MKSPVGWFLPAVAIVATGIAIWAGPNLAIALPAAGLAVLAPGLLFAGSWLDAEERRGRRAATGFRPEVFRLRSAIRSGPLGREELVTTLDRIERSGPTPNLRPRTVDEMHALIRVSPSEFRAYLRGRLDDLEARM
ncbi:MAG: hypothetical protein WB947_03815 [Thermoplasmata archaeon]